MGSVQLRLITGDAHFCLVDSLVVVKIDPAQFKPHQIVCLEHNHTYLYGEVIQVISARQLCWVRPLFMTIQEADSSEVSAFKRIDLRYTSDLLWPARLFRPALDTEVLPLIAPFEESLTEDQQAKEHLHVFIRQVWYQYRGIADR